ncbi:MAG TPA: HAD hydrolase-like protein [Bacilli bacterium]|nr:HAD hydrolase-like protein [Bacilli bacterium]
MILKNDIVSKKDLAIFDIDGTLVKYNTLEALVKEALRIYGIEDKDEYVKAQIKGVFLALKFSERVSDFNFERLCNSWQKSMPFLKEFGVDVKDFAHTMLHLETFYMEKIPKVKETLSTIEQIKVCSTNWLFYRQKIKLYEAGIDKDFSNIYTCEKTYAKPNPEHFRYILAKEDVFPTSAVMIGDGIVDLASSRAGIDSILVDYDENKQKLYNDAIAVVTEFSDIARILKR